MYSYCDTEQHVRSQEAIPCDNPFTYESLHAGFPPILELILGIVKVTYAHYQKKKKKTLKRYTSIWSRKWRYPVLSPPICFFHVAQKTAVFAGCPWALMSLITSLLGDSKVVSYPAPVYTVNILFISLHSSLLFYETHFERHSHWVKRIYTF